MADQFVGLAGTADAHGIGAGGIGAYVGTALFLGHGHADSSAGFLLDWQIAWVVLAREYFRQPVLCQVGL